MTPRCDDCGLFCIIADEYTDFGSAEMMEPPDPVWFCAKCSKANEDHIVAKTLKPARPFMPWRPARFHRNAVRRLGMVLAGPPMAAWCQAHWPDKVPDGWTIWSNPEPKGDDDDGTHID